MAEATTEKKPTVQEQFQTRSAENQAGITKAYDSGIAAQKQSLLDAYNANTGAQQTAGQTIRQTYGTGSNDLAVQNARNTGNINQFADVRNVNRQQGSQAALQLNNARARAESGLAFRQQQALAENQRQQDLAKAQYQAQVQAALADKDYKQAAALLDDYNNQNKWRDEQAQILATYGNFEPYKQLYGEDTANAMKAVWTRQNPDAAYQMGEMDPYTYYDVTGRWPAGFNPYGGGGLSFPGLYYDDGTPKPGAEKWLGGAGGGGMFGSPGGGGIARGRQVGSTSVAPRSSGNINTTW